MPGCDRSHRAKGLCQRHYQRRWLGRPLETVVRRGDTHGRAKLTTEQVVRIRELHDQGLGAGSARSRIRGSWDAVQSVITGRTWRHI